MKYGKKVEATKIFNQVFVSCWGDSSSDSYDSKQGGDASMEIIKDEVLVFNSLFPLMADIGNDEDNQMTLLNIKKNIKDYSHGKLRSLAFVLFDSKGDLAKDKENLRKALEKCEKKWWN